MYRAEIEDYINTLPHEERFNIEDDDGTFLIHYMDWAENFTNLFINIDFPEDWTGVRFFSAWTKSNSGGIPHKAKQELFDQYGRNPQFLMKPVKDT